MVDINPDPIETTLAVHPERVIPVRQRLNGAGAQVEFLTEPLLVARSIGRSSKLDLPSWEPLDLQQ